MSEEETSPLQIEVERIFASKAEWHKAQARLPLKDKVRILLKMQRDDYPILARRGVLRSWERPWNIEP